MRAALALHACGAWHALMLSRRRMRARNTAPQEQAAAEDRAGAGIRADLAGRRAGDARRLPRQGGGGDLHLHAVHRHLPGADADDVVRAGSARAPISARRSPSFRSPSIPERDTPEVLKEYAQAFGANLAGWSFLTGSPGGDPRRGAPLRRIRGEDRRTAVSITRSSPRSSIRAACCACSISACASIPRNFGATS